ncbi:hypothetical protein [Terrihalobacillus insolitus]|uniref:hypothetical protein n=1 Tax=Terrihalobacillus insolitus TaxID=2950438 RepID=UPI002341F297|nr:hypothetical protein [Terrihalobacillus insolitus]MDC3412507.1 helix-turn-helix transcriptional regulator [Terrihalobacillus insolitus]
MIKLEILKHQMDKMGINSYYLWKLTGIGYATINGLLNGDRKLETVQVKNYERIISSLFTPVERSLAERSNWGVEQYEAFYKQALIHALNTKDVKIYRSGAVAYDGKEPKSIPSHINVEWGYIDDKAINKTCREEGVGRHLHDLRIFDKDLYNEMGKKAARKISGDC